MTIAAVRHEQYNGNGSGLPWWVRAVTVMGVPSAIAVFLVYVGAKEIPALKAKVDLTYQAAVQSQAELREIKELLAANQRMLQRVCFNTAGKDENAQQRCFDK